jgi:DamX protein
MFVAAPPVAVPVLDAPAVQPPQTPVPPVTVDEQPALPADESSTTGLIALPEDTNDSLPEGPIAAIEAVPEPEIAPEPAPEPVIEPDSAPTLAEQVPLPPPAPLPETSAPEASAPAKAAFRSNDWLHSRKPARFTIQLIAATDREALAEFIQQHGLNDQAALLTVKREGRDWYVVVLGDYPSRAAGRAALQNIPTALRRDGAWIRSFSELQQLAPR